MGISYRDEYTQHSQLKELEGALTSGDRAPFRGPHSYTSDPTVMAIYGDLYRPFIFSHRDLSTV